MILPPRRRGWVDAVQIQNLWHYLGCRRCEAREQAAEKKKPRLRTHGRVASDVRPQYIRRMRRSQILLSGLLIRQDISEAVRPVMFQTDYEEFLYATHGGTLFLVRCEGRVFGLTCRHVFKDFSPGKLFISPRKFAEKGDMPAHVIGMNYPSNPVGDAVDSDVLDACLIEFDESMPSDFFGSTPYVLDKKNA